MIDLLAFQIGSTPLFHACLRGHVKVAKRLLEDPRTCLSLLKVYTQCLKILQKVLFDISASKKLNISNNFYLTKIIENAKMVILASFFKSCSLRLKSVPRQIIS